jgi:hypothetical protein
MTTLYLIPFFGAGAQFFNNQGAVLANGRLSTMVAGSVNTPLATYTDSTGNTPNGNPIILDSAGRLPAGTEMWCATALKIVLTDSASNPIAVWDNVPGTNNVGVPTQLEYFLSGLTPTYVSGTQITVPGNQIALFTTNRRVRYTQGAGVFYGYVTSSSFDGVVTTTVNITADATVISNTVYQIDYAFLNSVNPSIPQQYLPQASVFVFGGTAGGTANALALTPANPVSVYAAGLFFVFKAGASNNSGGTTCAVSGLAALAVQVNGQACTGNEIQAGLTYILAMDTPTTMQLSELVVAHGETAKTALVDADEMFTADSAASFLRKKITWANIKATFFAALGVLTAAGTDKPTPVGGDLIPIADSAATNATKKLSITNLATYLAGLCSAGWNALTATTAGNLTGTPAFFAPLSASLGANVSLNNPSNFFTGPSVAQGASGKWYASGTVTVADANAAIYIAKLWDGTTNLDSAVLTLAAGENGSIALSGWGSAPAGNLRISVQSTSATSLIIYSSSGTGKDSTITAFRIG